MMAGALVAAMLAGPLILLAGEASKPKPYPLTTCLVTGEKLGSMGDAYVFVHEGQEIKLCCKGCLKDFKKEPAKYLKKIAEANKNKSNRSQRP
jgi:YHS domain-containing protein